MATVRIAFIGPIELRDDLRAPQLSECVTAAIVPKVYPSWRGFNPVTMSGLRTFDGFESTFTDVPVNELVRFRLNDKNWCDRNSTGAVLADVTVNGVQLAQNAMTPGPTGDQPGFQFTVDRSGRVSQ